LFLISLVKQILEDDIMKCIVIQGGARKAGNVEADVNNWLANNPNIKVLHVAQSMNDARVLLTIFYE
jgi:hypothetical protein